MFFLIFSRFFHDPGVLFWIAHDLVWCWYFLFWFIVTRCQIEDGKGKGKIYCLTFVVKKILHKNFSVPSFSKIYRSWIRLLSNTKVRLILLSVRGYQSILSQIGRVLISYYRHIKLVAQIATFVLGSSEKGPMMKSRDIDS